MSVTACLCAKVDAVAGQSSQFTNLRKWGGYGPPVPLFHCPCFLYLQRDLAYLTWMALLSCYRTLLIKWTSCPLTHCLVTYYTIRTYVVGGCVVKNHAVNDSCWNITILEIYTTSESVQRTTYVPIAIAGYVVSMKHSCLCN